MISRMNLSTATIQYALLFSHCHCETASYLLLHPIPQYSGVASHPIPSHLQFQINCYLISSIFFCLLVIYSIHFDSNQSNFHLSSYTNHAEQTKLIEASTTLPSLLLLDYRPSPLHAYIPPPFASIPQEQQDRRRK